MMARKADLERLSIVRHDDALFLFQNNRCSSAYYLVGYAVELALKACIAKQFQQDAIPDKAFVNAVYVHKLDTLLGLAGLKQEFDAAIKVDPTLGAYWAIASNWSEESRYGMWEPFEAGSLVQAICDKDHGVFQWVKKHW